MELVDSQNVAKLQLRAVEKYGSGKKIKAETCFNGKKFLRLHYNFWFTIPIFVSKHELNLMMTKTSYLYSNPLPFQHFRAFENLSEMLRICGFNKLNDFHTGRIIEMKIPQNYTRLYHAV